MASSGGTVKVFRSDELYIVARADTGRLVTKERIGAPAPLGGLARHVHVVEPWVEITDLSTLPPLVREALTEVQTNAKGGAK
jgi:hypothetical protein